MTSCDLHGSVQKPLPSAALGAQPSTSAPRLAPATGAARAPLDRDVVECVARSRRPEAPAFVPRDIVASLPDSLGIGVVINAVGVAALFVGLGIPPSAAVTAIYLAIGTGVGSLYFPSKKALSRRLAPREGGPAVSIGPAQQDAHGRFTGATLLLTARPEEAAGRPSDARAFTAGRTAALDTFFTRRLSRCDLERIGLTSDAVLARLAETTGLPKKSLERLKAEVRDTSIAKERVASVSRFLDRGGVPALRAVLELTEAPRTLNAQAELEQHLAALYGDRLAVAVTEAIARTGESARLAHPTTADVSVHPAVEREVRRMVLEPGSGLDLDDRGCPVLSDRAQAPAVLARLAAALPPEAGKDAALLIDGSNGDRVYFGESQGAYVDAVSSAIMLAGTARAEGHGDRNTPDFLHSNSVVWSLSKTPLGLAAAQWSDVAEFHHLLPAPADQKLGAAFDSPNYVLFGPGSSDDALPGVAEARAVARAVVRGEVLPRSSAADAEEASIRWPERGSLLLDAALLRATEAFVRHLGPKGRIDAEGRIFIGGPKTRMTETESLAVCADLSLVLSAVSRTDSGLDAGGPFGSVLWNPRTGEATVGKNQVVPSRAAVNHGERVGLLVRPGDQGSWVVTSGEPCAMCFLACTERQMKIAFVVTTRGVEANTDFKEGKKDYSAAEDTVLGPETYRSEDGRVTVLGAPFLEARAPLGEKILSAFMRNGENYSV